MKRGIGGGNITEPFDSRFETTGMIHSSFSFEIKGMSLCPGKKTFLLISKLFKRIDKERFLSFCKAVGIGK